MAEKWNWSEVQEDAEVPIVFVLNLDIDGFKEWGKASHPKKHQEELNQFQSEVKKTLRGKGFYPAKEWTGDGFITLYKHPDMEADELIEKAEKFICLLRKWNSRKKLAKQIGVRIGIAVGTIIFQKEVGSISSEVMKKAGQLQKSCPGKGGIFMTDGVHRFIVKQDLKERFSPTLFMIGQEIRSMYYFPQDKDDPIPNMVTDKGISMEIDLTMLYGGKEHKGKFSELDAYLKSVDEQAKGVQDVILTGAAPTWLYLRATLRLKGKSKLFYKDGQGHLFKIFDHTLE